MYSKTRKPFCVFELLLFSSWRPSDSTRKKKTIQENRCSMRRWHRSNYCEHAAVKNGQCLEASHSPALRQMYAHDSTANIWNFKSDYIRLISAICRFYFLFRTLIQILPQSLLRCTNYTIIAQAVCTSGLPLLVTWPPDLLIIAVNHRPSVWLQAAKPLEHELTRFLFVESLIPLCVHQCVRNSSVW